MPKIKKTSRVKYYSPKRRAVYARGDEIDALVLFELHAWTCGICYKPINKYLRLPNFMAATIEHRLAISKGGTHTWDNVFPAHYLCNMQKGDADFVASEPILGYT